jgi:hypothetical protein
MDWLTDYPYVREVSIRCDRSLFSFEQVEHYLLSRKVHHREVARLLVLRRTPALSPDIMPTDQELSAAKGLRDVDYDRIFFYVEAFHINAASVLKLLWIPAKDRKKNRNATRAQRCDHLWRELSIRGRYVIENPDFRNDVEHFDERTNRLVALARNYFADMVVEPDTFGAPGHAPDQSFRAIDENTMEYTFYKRPFDLETAATELQEIGGKAKAWLSARHLL